MSYRDHYICLFPLQLVQIHQQKLKRINFARIGQHLQIREGTIPLNPNLRFFMKIVMESNCAMLSTLMKWLKLNLYHSCQPIITSLHLFRSISSPIFQRLSEMREFEKRVIMTYHYQLPVTMIGSQSYSKLMQNDLYKDLPNGCYEMKEEHSQDVRDLMIEAFVKNNKIWSSANLDRQQLGGFFLNVIKEHFESQKAVRRDVLASAVLNFIYVLNGKLVSCLMHYEIDEYRKQQSHHKESTIPLFRELEREGRELIKCVNVDVLSRGKYIYCTWAAHCFNPQYTQMRKVEEVAEIYDRIRVQGFDGMICRSSNLRVIQILYPLGGELLKESTFTRNQKQFKLYFAMLHLQNDHLGQFIQTIKRQKEEQIAPKF